MTAVKRGLGKGLGALLEDISPQAQNGVLEVDIFQVDNDVNQPRKQFDEEKLAELAQSIRTHGIMQPIVVYEAEGRYTIVAGERRFRAAKLAGLKTVPVIVKKLTQREIMELSLIENIQREDLNPLEQADALARLMQEYEITQEEVAQRVGKSRSAIANLVRLLSLPDSVKTFVMDGSLSAGHARTLLPLKEDAAMLNAAKTMMVQGMSARAAEQYVRQLLEPKHKAKPVAKQEPEFVQVQEEMSHALSTKVRIQGSNQKGKIVIDYYNAQQLEQLYEFLKTANQ